MKSRRPHARWLLSAVHKLATWPIHAPQSASMIAFEGSGTWGLITRAAYQRPLQSTSASFTRSFFNASKAGSSWQCNFSCTPSLTTFTCARWPSSATLGPRHEAASLNAQQVRGYMRLRTTEPAWRSHEWKVSFKKRQHLLQQLPRATFNVVRFDQLPRNVSNAKLTLMLKHASTLKDLYWVLRLHGHVLNYLHWAQFLQKVQGLQLYAPTPSARQGLKFLRNTGVLGMERMIAYMPPEHLVAFFAELVRREVVCTRGLLEALVQRLLALAPSMARGDLARVLSCLHAVRYQDWELIGTLCREYLYRLGGQTNGVKGEGRPSFQAANPNKFRFDSQSAVSQESGAEQGGELQPQVNYHLAMAPLNLAVTFEEVVQVTAALANFTPYVYVPVEVTGVDRSHVQVEVALNGRRERVYLPYTPGFFVNKTWVPAFCEAQAVAHALANHASALLTSGAVAEVDAGALITYVAALAQLGALRPDLQSLFQNIMAPVELETLPPASLQQLLYAGMVQGEQLRMWELDPDQYPIVTPQQWERLVLARDFLGAAYKRSRTTKEVQRLLGSCGFRFGVERSVQGYHKAVDILVYGSGGRMGYNQRDLQADRQPQATHGNAEGLPSTEEEEEEELRGQQIHEASEVERTKGRRSGKVTWAGDQRWDKSGVREGRSGGDNSKQQAVEGGSGGSFGRHDIPQMSGMFAVEVDGPLARSSDATCAPRAQTLWSQRLLQRVDIPVVRVAGFEMHQLQPKERKGYVLRKIGQGLQLL